MTAHPHAIPFPADFHARVAEIQGPITAPALIRAFGLKESADRTVRRWAARAGVHLESARETVVVPDDWAENCARMTKGELIEHYGLTDGRYRSIRVRSGIDPAIKAEPQYTPRARPTGPVKPQFDPFYRPLRRHHDGSRATDAQDFLQRRWSPLWRCTADGTANQGGSYFTTGRIVMTADEMMERARRKGWDPEAWKALA